MARLPEPTFTFTSASRLVGLPPLMDDHTHVLVLGSFPGVASLAQQQYYGHPRNHFWPVMAHVFQAFFGSGAYSESTKSYQKNELGVPLAYADRCAWLLAHGVGLWDVYAACQRPGSLDADIRAAEPNDLSGLLAQCPRLKLVAHNGGESGKHMRHTRALFGPRGVQVVPLPSTSPANASWSLARKQAAWGAALGPALVSG
ncbi:MAG TPA: DNA-deoxyinosine glycosylase [Burkholderiaceae bacterium]|nr:DNA-deoxyinosine glycosylase [Burkholderiaceae bacterium]